MAKTKSQKVDAYGRNTDGKYIKVERYLYESPAWRSLSSVARDLWLELTYRYNGKNNGKIFLSYREARTRLNCGNSKVQKAYETLEDRMFIRKTKKGGFCQKYDAENSRATEYKLTHLLKTDDPDFHAFMRWPGKID